MAWPAIISLGLAFSPHKIGRSGPWEYNGNLYGVFADTTALEVWKSTDKGQSWAEVDQNNHGNASASFDSQLVGSKIHIVGSTPGGSVVYWAFDCSTDQWITGANVGSSMAVVDASVSQIALGICVTNDGDIYVFYSASYSNMGTKDAVYFKKSSNNGASWGTATQFSPALANHYNFRGTAEGVNNVVHAFLWSNSGSVIERHITSSDALATQSANSLPSWTTNGLYIGPSSKIVAGSTYVASAAAYNSGSQYQQAFFGIASADSTSAGSVFANALGGTSAQSQGNTGVGGLAQKSSITYALWPDYNSAGIYLDMSGSGNISFSSFTTWKASVTATKVDVQAITVAGGAVGVFYDDSGVVTFDGYPTLSSGTTNTRTIVATAAIQASNPKTVASTAAISRSLITRTITSTVAISVVGQTRTVGSTASINIVVTSSRTVGSTAAITRLAITRTVGSTAAITRLAITRTVVSTAALSVLAITRTITTPTAAITRLAITRTVGATAAIQVTTAKSFTATAAITRLAITRTVGVDASISLGAVTLTRTITPTASIRDNLWFPTWYSNPAKIAVWINPDEVPGADTTAIADFAEHSPNARSVDAYGVSSQPNPTIEYNEVNGHKTIRFSGFQGLRVATGISGDQFTVIQVWRRTNATGAAANDDYWTSVTTNDTFSTHSWSEFNNRSLDMMTSYHSNPSGAGMYIVREELSPDTDPHIIVEVWNRASAFGSFDGVIWNDNPFDYGDGNDLTGADISDGIDIGIDMGTLGTTPFMPNVMDGDLLLFAILPYVADSEEVELWEGFAAHRFTISLPAGHPYQSAAPTWDTRYRTIESTASIQTTHTRTIAATSAISVLGITRTIGTTISITFVRTRTVASTAAISVSAITRTVGSTAIIALSKTRTVGSTVALSRSLITRTVATAAAINTTLSRTITTPTAAITRLAITRTVGSTAAITRLGITRTVAATAAITATNAKPITATAAVSVSAITRTIVVDTSIHVVGQGARTVFASAAVSVSAITRTVGSTASLTFVRTRTVASTVAIVTTPSRTVVATSALRTILSRTVAATAALQQTNARPVTSTVAIQTTRSRTVVATAQISVANNRRTVVADASVVVQGVGIRTVASAASIAILGLSRTVGASTAVAIQRAQTVVATAAIQATISKPVATTVAVQTTTSRTVGSDASVTLILVSGRVVTATVAIATTNVIPVATDAAVSATMRRIVQPEMAVRVTEHRTVVVTAMIAVGFAPPAKATVKTRRIPPRVKPITAKSLLVVS